MGTISEDADDDIAPMHRSANWAKKQWLRNFPKKKAANLCWRSHSLPPREVAPGFISDNRR